MRKNKKGFTLVELIVVLVILGILIALLVPSLTGYIDKARKKAKLAECRQCVVAAQTILSEIYGETPGLTVMELQQKMVTAENKAKIKELAEVPGKIENIVVGETAVIKKLSYITTNNIKVIYEKGGDPEYYISTDKIYSEDAPGYKAWIEDLGEQGYDVSIFLDENGKFKEEYKKYFGNNYATEVSSNASRRLQAIYAERFGGLFPAVNWDEVKFPSSVSPPSGDYVWKPIVTSSGEVIITADSIKSAGNSNASVVYYNGNYYYHWNGYNASNVDSASISDKTFDVSNLENDKQWIKVQ